MKQLACTTVYVVDDDDAIRESMDGLLSTYGASVISFATAGEVREAALDASHACMLLDIQLPDGNGIDLLRWLRRQGRTFPVILITGERKVSRQKEAAATDALALLEKPFDADALVDLLRGAVRRADVTA